MSSPGTAIDPLFWPLLIFAATMAIFVLGFVVTVVVLTRRGPGVHIQHAETGGVIEHKPRSTPTLDVGEVRVNSPQFPGGGGG